MTVKIIGAGMAGIEAANYLANHGIKVKLYEMRPVKMTEAHKTEKFGELVCSNSLRSNLIDVAAGALKQEMSLLGSLVMESANINRVEAGSALAVSREEFSEYITNKLKNNPNIEICLEEVKELNPDEYTIVCTGPLTSLDMASYIKSLFGLEDFYFFDAQAPIIKASSINYDICYFKSRYDKGEASYLNCPMTKDQYDLFYNELINAKEAELHDFDQDLKVFEGCMPVEVMAKRGHDALLYGPLKPMGLTKDINNKPYAVVQLRQDDSAKTLYNLVGFQTHLAFSEQKRVFSLIPGLENMEIVKYGRMHKNTYINSPKILNTYYQCKQYPKIFFAGQITGVEGYIESASSGILAAINMLRLIEGNELLKFPKETIMGSLADYISSYHEEFIPMNANYGIVPELEDVKGRPSKKERKEMYGTRAVNKMKEFIDLWKIKI